jgi:CheY-like chemotaxis protein
MSSTVLVVDDEPDIRMLARMILETSGYEVVEAKTGEEALDVLAATPPDLMLLDIRLPGIDGWEVLTRSRAASEPVPVVMMSAHSSDSTLQRAEEEGSAGYLVKPFKQSDLLNFVDKHLAP